MSALDGDMVVHRGANLDWYEGPTLLDVLEAADAGALSRAAEPEAGGFLQLTLAVGEKIGWTGGFGIVR